MLERFDDGGRQLSRGDNGNVVLDGQPSDRILVLKDRFLNEAVAIGSRVLLNLFVDFSDSRNKRWADCAKQYCGG